MSQRNPHHEIRVKLSARRSAVNRVHVSQGRRPYSARFLFSFLPSDPSPHGFARALVKQRWEKNTLIHVLWFATIFAPSAGRSDVPIPEWETAVPFEDRELARRLLYCFILRRNLSIYIHTWARVNIGDVHVHTTVVMSLTWVERVNTRFYYGRVCRYVRFRYDRPSSCFLFLTCFFSFNVGNIDCGGYMNERKKWVETLALLLLSMLYRGLYFVNETIWIVRSIVSRYVRFYQLYAYVILITTASSRMRMALMNSFRVSRHVGQITTHVFSSSLFFSFNPNFQPRSLFLT